MVKNQYAKLEKHHSLKNGTKYINISKLHALEAIITYKDIKPIIHSQLQKQL